MLSAAAQDDDLPAREAVILDELAELGLELARGLQQRALAAEAAQEAAALATAFQRVARTVRQCLALKGKLGRDARREGRESRREAEADRARRIRERKALVMACLERAIDEQTSDDHEDLAGSRLEDLSDRLDEELLDERFLDADLAEVIARLHRRLGLKPPGSDEPADPDLDEPAEAAAAARQAPPPEPWQANGRLAPPIDLPGWETG